jgi:hypothetical protein
MTLQERAELLVHDIGNPDYYDRAETESAVVLAMQAAIDEDRTTRPSLVGQPMSEEEFQRAKAACIQRTETLLAFRNDHSASAARAAVEAADALVEFTMPLVGYVDFLRSLLADLTEEGSAYDRGLADGKKAGW